MPFFFIKIAFTNLNNFIRKTRLVTLNSESRVFSYPLMKLNLLKIKNRQGIKCLVYG